MSTSFYSWDNVVNSERAKIAFSSRNKEFGGFVIRNSYERAVLIAFAISIAFMLSCLSIPYVSKLLSKLESEMAKKEKVVDVTTLQQPPPMDENQAPPPPPPPPAPLVKQIKFTPPKVVKDEEVPQDEQMKSQEDVSKVQNIGTKDQEGLDQLVLPDQNVNQVIEEPKEEEIFLVVEQTAEFPGGMDELPKYLSKNIQYPDVARENLIKGRVILQFVVEPDGRITNIVTMRDIGGGCAEEAIRVVKNMPKWKPGKQNGRAVRQRYTLPILFNLNIEE